MAFKPGTFVSTEMLNRTFPVNKEKGTIKVEPKVAMDELVAATQKEGFVPQVVPELMGLTAGGAFSGTAGESSSWRHGMFEDTVCEIEIVTGDGTIYTANAESHPDLFEWSGSSMGTLGVVTLLEIKLIPAKKYVQLEIKPTTGIEDAMEQMEVGIKEPNVEFVDSMLFNKGAGVVMFGKYTDKPEGAEVLSFVKRNEPWFSNYIEKVGADKNKPPKPIAMPTEQYYFRYDRGVFWGGKLAFNYFHVPFNRVTRWALDPLMGSRVAYHALHEGGFANKYIVQDCACPRSKAGPFMKYLASVLPDYQFYLCPAMNGRDLGIMNKLLAPGGDEEKLRTLREERIFNVGVYGKGPTDHDAFIKLNREIEHKLWYDFCGLKMLYAHAYYTETELQAIYNREPYEEVRAKYKSDGLPTVYDKIAQDMGSGRKPPKHLAGTRGAVKAFLGLLNHKRRTSYLLDKRQTGGTEPTTYMAKSSADVDPQHKDVKRAVNGTTTTTTTTNGVNGSAEKTAQPEPESVTANGAPTVNGTVTRDAEKTASAAAALVDPTSTSLTNGVPQGAAVATTSSTTTKQDAAPRPALVPGESVLAIPLPDESDKSEATALQGATAIEKPVQVPAGIVNNNSNGVNGADPIAAADGLFEKAMEAKEGAGAGVGANGEVKA
jgi:Delta24-sterol reductase